MDCPIGLICEYFECRPQVCANYARAVPLPFYFWDIDNYLYLKGALISCLPDFEEDPEIEDSDLPDEDYGSWQFEHPDLFLDERENYNAWIERVRQSMREGGWHGSCDLPYRFNPSLQALQVFDLLILRGDDELFDKGTRDPLDYSDRGFCPALLVKAPMVPNPSAYTWDLRLDGFCYHELLWPRHFYENQMQDC